MFINIYKCLYKFGLGDTNISQPRGQYLDMFRKRLWLQGFPVRALIKDPIKTAYEKAKKYPSNYTYYHFFFVILHVL